VLGGEGQRWRSFGDACFFVFIVFGATFKLVVAVACGYCLLSSKLKLVVRNCLL